MWYHSLRRPTSHMVVKWLYQIHIWPPSGYGAVVCPSWDWFVFLVCVYLPCPQCLGQPTIWELPKYLICWHEITYHIASDLGTDVIAKEVPWWPMTTEAIILFIHCTIWRLPAWECQKGLYWAQLCCQVWDKVIIQDAQYTYPSHLSKWLP